MVEKNDALGARNVFLFEFGLTVQAALKCLF